MADANLQVIFQQLEAEKSIDRDKLLEAIRTALESAARKSFHPKAEIVVEVDPASLTFKVFEIREVAEQVTDDTRQIPVEEAQAMNAEAVAGDRLKVPAEPKDFGRIAAQTAKQVIIQKLKDAERENVYDEFKQREGEMVTGVVKRVSHGNIIVSIGRADAVLPIREQSPRENFKPGDRIRAFLVEVDKSPRGPQVVLSRACPELVRALFELEVPEIYDGTVDIKGIAREAGNRTKIAVHSNDSNVDPVGACVGMKGSRVRAVVEELCGEKIDIVRWSDDPVEMCTNALNPADILDISVDDANGVILVVVPHDQLSLAIGKRGQNARLASKLMGWNIDIKSDVELTGEGSPDGKSQDKPAEDESGISGAEHPGTDAHGTVESENGPETSEGAAEPDTGAEEDCTDTETRGEG
ncbi:MAG TPA: transcription termination factor NusA [Candidatus Hydrogenedentes bacterium]|nr:transcription termination factor NusA [Candidatus Hydrogenedentota bacterium]HQE83800.1 transcription termination factor NusA [Candidatus Hydrogenedentota bacterium]HQH53340.1 transcription termination factor NusA [Candidatus Hydrogenedentota bacterium]HQM49134.1 transcription termination factor NusA [Candidatus Hydrogenedentota bacterium]